MQIDWNQLGGAATFAGVVVSAVIGLWRAIKTKMDRAEIERDEKRKEQLQAIRAVMDDKVHAINDFMSSHEAKDQSRHTDNIAQFKEIRAERRQDMKEIYGKLDYYGRALTALGWRNGTGHVEGEGKADKPK